MRRLVLQHSTGPYPGLRQIIGVIPNHDEAPSPEVLPPPGKGMTFEAWPDGRLIRARRLNSSEKFVLYLEA
jgi:hypothetical protein